MALSFFAFSLMCLGLRHVEFATPSMIFVCNVNLLVGLESFWMNVSSLDYNYSRMFCVSKILYQLLSELTTPLLSLAYQLFNCSRMLSNSRINFQNEYNHAVW